MRCSYCGVEITTYPDNGICANCGGKLPPRPNGIRCSRCGSYTAGNFCANCGQSLSGSAPQPTPSTAPAQPAYMPFQPLPGINCCPRCRSDRISTQRKGFSWGWAIAGFFLIPGFGILLGLIGRNNLHCRCQLCGHKWIRRL